MKDRLFITHICSCQELHGAYMPGFLYKQTFSVFDPPSFFLYMATPVIHCLYILLINVGQLVHSLLNRWKLITINDLSALGSSKDNTCMEFVCSRCVYVGFQLVIQFPPILQKYADEFWNLDCEPSGTNVSDHLCTTLQNMLAVYINK